MDDVLAGAIHSVVKEITVKKESSEEAPVIRPEPEEMEAEEDEAGGYLGSQLSDSVRRWMQDTIPVYPHVVQGLKPITPTFHTPSPHEGFKPISAAATPKYGEMPADADNLEEL